MAVLAAHLRTLRRRHSGDRLLALFEVEGAILDPRTGQPRDGVFDAIRWLQLQPGVAIGLISTDSDARRAETLAALDRLGAAHRARFSGVLLFGDAHTPDSAAAALRAFGRQGYRVAAVISGAVETLRAFAATGAAGEILLLRADAAGSAPPEFLTGAQYDLTRLASPRTLPEQVELVWHGLNDEPNLRQFLASDIVWGECDIHLDLRSGELVLHHDEVADEAGEPVEGWLRLDDLLARLAAAGKSAKLDLKAGPELIAPSLALVRRHGFPDDRLWLNGYVSLLGEAGFRRLAEAHPGAIVQAPIMFLEQQVISAPGQAHQTLVAYSDWGMNRFSLDWRSEQRAVFFDRMEAWGFAVNLYGVENLRSFLQAVLLAPRSVTADFNFPEWRFYGRGSGEHGVYYEYQLRADT